MPAGNNDVGGGHSIYEKFFDVLKNGKSAVLQLFRLWRKFRKRVKFYLMNIFAYGTLMIPAVMYAVTGRQFRFKKGMLGGYARFGVKGESFPGIIPQANANTEGKIYLNVDEPSLTRLDIFEGDLYRRTMVRVETAGEEVLNAEAYVIKPECRGYLSSKAWDVNTFNKTHLKRFLETFQGFSKDIL